MSPLIGNAQNRLGKLIYFSIISDQYVHQKNEKNKNCVMKLCSVCDTIHSFFFSFFLLSAPKYSLDAYSV